MTTDFIDPSARVVLTCETCAFEIANNSGGVWIDNDDIRRILRGETPLRGWRVQHWRCAPGGAKADVYDIEQCAIQTCRQFQDWEVHLGLKRWFAATDWPSLVEIDYAEPVVRLGRAA